MTQPGPELPAGYPYSWEADVVLRDGTVAHVRPIRPDDDDTLQRFHAAQSEESIYLRFFAPIKRLSDKDVHRFTHVDYVSRVALIVEVGAEMVAVGRYDRVDGDSGPTAEVAFNVSDAYQGRGVGSVLLEHLAAIGQEAGVERFVADVLPQNSKMLTVFSEAGYEVSREFDDGVVALSFDIEPTEQSQEVRAAREQRAESVSVRSLMRPRSVAVVGVSARDVSVGRQVFLNLLNGGFTGELWVVSTSEEPIKGHDTYQRVSDVPGPVDLVVVAVPAEAVQDVVLDCARAGVRALLVVSAGFAEAGPEGELRQAELLQTARRHGMRVVGPNSFGLINTRDNQRLNASFAEQMPPAGHLGLFAQSGALGIAVLGSAARRGLGLSDFVSAGNRVDVSGNDLMQYWFDDPDTDAVGLYLESMGNPRKFSRIARRLASRKPVIVVKTGVSSYGVPPGHRVRETRTSPDAFQAMLRQAGVIRVDGVHQMFDVAQLVLNQPMPQGNRVAIVGNSDALGVLAADTAANRGLDIVHGPVALPAEADAATFEAALDEAFADPDVDSVITCFIRPLVTDGTEVARVLARSSAASDKPCITVFLGMHGALEELASTPVEGGRRRVVPSYSMPEDGVRALAAATRYGEWRARDHGHVVHPEGIDRAGAERLVDEVLAGSPQGRRLQTEEVAALLACYGIEVWPVVPVEDRREAVRAARKIGYPVVLKSVSPLVRHQPVTAVRVDISSDHALREAYAALDERLAPLHANRFVVQRMATPGTPCVIGSTEDPLFGPVVTFGVGGAPTELLGDIGYRIPPLTDVDVSDLIMSVKAAPLLHGHHGAAPVDRAALEDLIARISVLADQIPEVASLELNPVNCHADGLEVLGASIALTSPDTRKDSGRRALS
ncbi:bifunctional GNAT family N-acetyltransferase/acetate--CoA ligase family protein [Luteipulveratus mongoliensis]|uniref:Multidrug ABC transporter permease n=1 Tax=Luteipulveratus mongoliensis TaxID=571913 RepID=A0A0K1JKG9_9MICO|nr:bifunctional GNAT family N-acetyltransferase/acetate--CoA ligase family protein [Luteipulveratus mongoliensis]AKU17085.1 multidrug ABC transporter permease [Luteipulveratus mongoliensis]